MSEQIILLSKILRLPLRLMNSSTVFYAFDEHPNHIIGIIITRENSVFIITKLINILMFISKFLLLKIWLLIIKQPIMNIYAVYPSIENPTATFQLHCNAQIYSESQIVAQHKTRLKGVLSILLRKVLGFNPSLSTLIVVVNKH